jgi:hypothetical protein
VNKEQLLDLTERVKELAGIELPIIVGSQAVFGVTSRVPEIVQQSIECDYLLLAVGPSVFRAVINGIGFASDFQETHGYYADALGLATVVLLSGWQERLVPLKDSEETVRAHCLEIYDACVSKLMAGREKDFVFIRNLAERGLIDLATFADRTKLVLDMPQRDALRPRLQALLLHFGNRRTTFSLEPVRALIRELRG